MSHTGSGTTEARATWSRPETHAGAPAKDPLPSDAPTPIAPCREAPTSSGDAIRLGAGIHAGNQGATGPDRQTVIDALATVLDPELNLSVVTLGLIYDIAIQDDRVAITMTLTAPGCPLHEVMVDWVRRAVEAIPGVGGVDVTVTFDPPWTPARIAKR